MACASCGTTTKDGTPGGCGSKGHCASGSCNRMNTFDWLTVRGIRDVADQHFVEVSFNRGKRKDFFYAPPELGVTTGDTVIVEADKGTDIGYVTLSGEIVFAQLKRRRVRASSIKLDVVRVAHERDCERLAEARRLEKATLVRARVIAYATELPIKLTDVDYQGDLRKATFYYTSEERVDFRALIRSLSREFEVSVEMRLLGARQEAARIGGIGSCGRELCCSTWLTDFKNVNTVAARYQGLALNQEKLAGQCGRLKCCLNYELDTYLDALDDFPNKADKLRFESGRARLVKTDVFKRLMTYAVTFGKTRGPYVTLTVDQVKEVLANPEGDVYQLVDIDKARQDAEAAAAADEFDYEDVTGAVDIPLEKRRRKKKGGQRGGQKGGRPGRGGGAQGKTQGGGGGGKGRRRGQKSGGGEGGSQQGGGAQGKTEGAGGGGPRKPRRGRSGKRRGGGGSNPGAGRKPGGSGGGE